MNKRTFAGRVILLLLALVHTASSAGIAAETDLITRGDVVMAECSRIATALNMKFEHVVKANVVTFCTDPPAEVCIPVKLTADNHIVVDEKGDQSVYVQKALLEQTLRIAISGSGVVTKTGDPTDSSATNGYNAVWPAGRGFGKGQTVPDIPLMDMDGKEVRFSSFLGRRYVLYCWASW